ncbi:MAG: NADH-quinone oxidoreductase subunit M [Ignavibacteria bacterium]|nr:NADH-quinone oxidoreductase subunit M [Ignavibacteria bacterium]
MQFHLLSYLILTPLVGGVLLLFLNKEQEAAAKTLALAISIGVFVMSLFAYFQFDVTKTEMQFVENIPWIASLNIGWHLGIDGISLLLILLTTFLTPIALLSSWNSITKNVKQFVAMFLFLEVGMLGVFCSLDLFLFYIFWEAMLIPMYFIIGIWGGEQRVYAAVKFFLFTMFGSLLMLVAILWLGYYSSTMPNGVFTVNYEELLKIAPTIPATIQLWLFAAFALSFAIKVPLFPFHTWLPDAHVQAPTAGSVILAGVLLKMGTYGMLRFCIPLFPQASITFAPYLSMLAVIGIIYGALVSMVQPDMKKLVAYSSVSHLGFVVLGIFSGTEEGIQGATIQMINHGLSTGCLFLLVGMIYDRRHTRLISEFGGIAKVMPIFATLFMLVTLSSAGLPGLNGFVGEFLILLGAFKSTLLANKAYAILSATGVILAAVYLLWMYQRVIFGNITNEKNKSLVDLSMREIFVLALPLIFIVWLGIYPSTFMKLSSTASKVVVEKIHGMTNMAHAKTQSR